MTTLAFCNGVLAADSQATQDETVALGEAKKIHTPTEDEYWEIQGIKVLAFGLCGNAQDLAYVKEELSVGVTHRTRIQGPEVLDFLIIAVTEDGMPWYWGINRNPRRQHNYDIVVLEPLTGPATGGSGQTIATAVLSVTGCAVKAIEAAIKLDIYSGGPVQAWTYPGKPEVMSTRPVKEAAPSPLSKEQMVEIMKQAGKAAREALARNLGEAPVTQESPSQVEKVQEHGSVSR